MTLMLPLLTFSLLSILSITHAQTGTSPQPVQEYAFARAGSKLYIQGGHFVQNGTPTIVSNQLFSLDLSTNWSVDSPPWKALAPGAQQWFFYAVATPDNKTIITIKRSDTESYIISKYDIASNSWVGAQEIIPSTTESRNGMRPVIDPATSLVYMNGMQYLNIYNPNTSVVNLQLIPTNVFPTRQYAGAVYNAARNSVMYFGGSNAAYQLVPTATFITEYRLTDMSWGVFPATGTPPDARADCCMASSDDGNTVVVYGGGVSAPTNFTGSLYVLDVPSGKWTRGPDGNVRIYTGCIIVGTQFLAWGGGNSNNTYTGSPVIFDLATRKWVKNYTAPAYYQNLPSPTSNSTGGTPSTSNTPSPSATPPPGQSSSSLPAILGGTIGGLFVAALAVFFIYRKRKQDKIIYDTPSERQQQPPPSSQDRDQDNNNDNTPVPAIHYQSKESRMKTQDNGHDDAPVPAMQYQKPKESQTRNPHMTGVGDSPARNPQMAQKAGFNDNLARNPQMIQMAGFNDNPARSPQDISMGNVSHYAPQQQHDFVNAAPVPFTGGLVLPEKDSYQTAMTSPAFVMAPKQAASTPTMGYVLPGSEYIPANAMTEPVHYATPSSQAFYSTDEYGNVYQVTPVSTVSNGNVYHMPPTTTMPPTHATSATGHYW